LLTIATDPVAVASLPILTFFFLFLVVLLFAEIVSVVAVLATGFLGVATVVAGPGSDATFSFFLKRMAAMAGVMGPVIWG